MSGNEPQAARPRSFLEAEGFRWLVVTLLIPLVGFVWDRVQDRDTARQIELENARGESDIVMKLMPALANTDEASAEQGIALALLLNLANRKALSPELASAVSLAIVAAQERVKEGKASVVEVAALSRIAAATDVTTTSGPTTGATRGPSTQTVAQELVVQVPRVYIHIFDPSDQEAATKLQEWIAGDRRWLAPGVENVTTTADRRGGRALEAPPSAQVRYFNGEDVAKADEVAQWLRDHGRPDAQTVKPNLPAPKGQLEVWFPRPR